MTLEKRHRVPLVLVAVLVVLVALLVFRGGDTGGAPEASPTPFLGETKEFSVSASEFSLSPGQIRVDQGDRVRITYRNDGTAVHNLIVPAFRAFTQLLSPGQTQVVEFVADRSGTFEFYCSVGKHRALGMEGALEVA